VRWCCFACHRGLSLKSWRWELSRRSLRQSNLCVPASREVRSPRRGEAGRSASSVLFTKCEYCLAGLSQLSARGRDTTHSVFRAEIASLRSQRHNRGMVGIRVKTGHSSASCRRSLTRLTMSPITDRLILPFRGSPETLKRQCHSEIHVGRRERVCGASGEGG
jgi:hypothetical protein